METKINKKIETYIHNYRELLKTNIIEVTNDQNLQNKLLEAVYSINTLQLDKQDFTKRKRVVSSVSLNERCTAKKATGEQCTRKKKVGCNFCGTHDKYQPHGVVTLNINETCLKRCTITIEDINGINYYLDENNNVYDTRDIILNTTNPKIIGYKDVILNKVILH